MKEKYSWLEQDDERRYARQEILDKYVDLKKACLSDSEKKQVTDTSEMKAAPLSTFSFDTNFVICK